MKSNFISGNDTTIMVKRSPDTECKAINKGQLFTCVVLVQEDIKSKLVLFVKLKALVARTCAVVLSSLCILKILAYCCLQYY